MKKLIVSASILACVLALACCSSNSADVANFAGISGLVTEKGYTEENLQEGLLGKHRDSIVNAWGEPDGMLSGFWGDVWYLRGKSNKQIILYYDRDGTVQDIRIAERYMGF